MTVDVSPVLVGRIAELNRLRAALDRSCAGTSTVVLLAGDAGVGKSRLVDAALGTADGLHVLTGGCTELGGAGLPFVPLVDALRTLARTAPAADLDRWLGPARAELGRLLPELAPVDGTSAGSGGSTAQLFELLLGVLSRLADERPLVLVLEDLHWADRSTLELVAFLVRAMQRLRVLLVLSYRSDEVDRRSPLRPLLSTCERMRGTERIQLGPFNRDEVAAQMAGILGTAPDPALVDTVFDRSEGNAFFVEELLRAVRDGAPVAELPPSLRDVLLSRVDGLTPSAQRLLRTAAVAGRWVPERLLAEVAAVPATELYEALREAVDASLLVVDSTGRGYTFRHALTRDAIYEELLPGERVDLHVAYAKALAQEPALAGDYGSVAATLALHWYAAHDLPRALAASVRAGREAVAAFAPAEARRHFERALEIWRGVPDAEQLAGIDQAEVLRLTAATMFDGGEAKRALPLLQQAMELVGSDAERAALLVEQRAATLRILGEDGASVVALEEALGRLPTDPVTLGRAALLGALANTLLRLNAERTFEVACEALEAARAVGSRALEASALVTSGSVISYQRDPSDGESAIREGLQIALEANEHVTALRGYINLSDVLENRGLHRAAADAAKQGMELAAKVGLTRSFGAYLAGNLAEPLVRLGEWAEAERLATRTLTDGLIGVFAASLHELLGYLAVHTGRPDEAMEHVREARRELGDSPEPQFVHALAYIEAEVARTRGSFDTATVLAAGGLATDESWLARYSWPLVWLAVRIAADTSTLARDRQATRAGETRSPLAGLPPIESLPSASSPAVHAFRASTFAERARAEGASATMQWYAAVEAWEDAVDAWPRAYALFRLAEALCADGDRSAAAAPLSNAWHAARRLGAAPLVDDVEALARRARIPLGGETDETDETADAASATTAETPFHLTDREREVLVLLAAGRSNGQIAKELFISPKTASVHVSNILAKLGVHGRVEAAAVAHRLGLTSQRTN